MWASLPVGGVGAEAPVGLLFGASVVPQRPLVRIFAFRALSVKVAFDVATDVALDGAPDTAPDLAVDVAVHRAVDAAPDIAVHMAVEVAFDVYVDILQYEVALFIRVDSDHLV